MVSRDVSYSKNGNVDANSTCVQILMTKYRIVIAFTTPLIDEFLICYVNNLEDVSHFLIKFYDKEPIVVVLDDNHGNDTEEYDS